MNRKIIIKIMRTIQKKIQKIKKLIIFISSSDKSNTISKINIRVFKEV